MRFVSLSACVLTTALLASCGGSDGVVGPASTEPNPVIATSATTTSSVLPVTTSTAEVLVSTDTVATSPGDTAAYATSVDLKNQDGWLYTYTPHLIPVKIALSKDISQSPPGKAGIKAAIHALGSIGNAGSVVNATPGRSAPELHTANLVNECWNTGANKNILLGSYWEGNGVEGTAKSYCIGLNYGFADLGASDLVLKDLDETTVDNAVKHEQNIINSGLPFYVVSIQCDSSQAGTVVLFPDGRVGIGVAGAGACGTEGLVQTHPESSATTTS